MQMIMHAVYFMICQMILQDFPSRCGIGCVDMILTTGTAWNGVPKGRLTMKCIILI